MRLSLKPHEDSPSDAAMCIDVDVSRPRPGTLVLHYSVTGATSALRLPRASFSARRDELWRHTCFEVFLRVPPSTAYCEFNFSPSTEWAAYRFDAYRSGMSVADEIGTPRIEAQSSGTCCELRVAMELDGLPGLPNDAAWQLGLSVVIEETSGSKSYWALAHPPGRPDFHHSDCFALPLPAPSLP